MLLDIRAQTRVYDTNALWWGMSIEGMMEKAGKGISKIVIDEYGKNKSISVICGLGNNGGDGMSAARYLVQNGIENLKVFLIGRPQDLKTDAARTNLHLLQEISNKYPRLRIKFDSYAKDIGPVDVVLESLLGTGLKGRLHKRFKDVVTRINSLDSDKITIDTPISGYKYDLAITMHISKVQGAKVVDIGIPKEVNQFVGPGEVNELSEPQEHDYKTQTGELFVFGGSKSFHGAPMMTIAGASKFIGSVYFYTIPSNRHILTKLKQNIAEFITVDDAQIEKYASYADVLLMGPGLEDNLLNRALIEKLCKLFPDKKKIFDAYAIAMAPKDNLENCILTPHRGELRHLWGDETVQKSRRLESNLRRYAVEHKCIIILKGHIDMIFRPSGEVKFNLTGNAGMAKGGSGDILSGIIGAFATKNNMSLSANAGIFINGLAGDMIYQDVGYNYSSTDLVPYLPKAVHLCTDIKASIKNMEKLRLIVNPQDRI